MYEIMSKSAKGRSFTCDHMIQWVQSEIIGQGSLKQKVNFHTVHNLIAY